MPMSNTSLTSDHAGLMLMVETNQQNGIRNTVKSLSTQFGFSIASCRKVLIAHYGNRITFTKGRTGGIMISK